MCWKGEIRVGKNINKLKLWCHVTVSSSLSTYYNMYIKHSSVSLPDLIELFPGTGIDDK